MHQIDRWIGLQQPPPGALTLMRLARNKQHPQPIANAVDLHHRPVIELGDLARQRTGRHFDDRRAGAGDRHLDPLLDADRDAGGAIRLAVASDGQCRRTGMGGHPQIVHHDPQRDGFPDNAVARRFDHAQAAVDFLALACQQQIKRRAARGGGRNVMHLPVGDRDRAGKAGAGDIGKRTVHLGE